MTSDEAAAWETAAVLHNAAMARVDEAQQARRDGAHSTAKSLMKDAAYWEGWAASRTTTEPTRSILYRSAATLALEAGWPERARELALRGLDGSPPEAIADELRGVLARC